MESYYVKYCIYREPFAVESDHKSLQRLQNMKDQNSRIIRMYLILTATKLHHSAQA